MFAIATVCFVDVDTWAETFPFFPLFVTREMLFAERPWKKNSIHLGHTDTIQVVEHTHTHTINEWNFFLNDERCKMTYTNQKSDFSPVSFEKRAITQHS